MCGTALCKRDPDTTQHISSFRRIIFFVTYQKSILAGRENIMATTEMSNFSTTTNASTGTTSIIININTSSTSSSSMTTTTTPPNPIPPPDPKEIQRLTLQLAEQLNSFCASHTFQSANAVNVTKFLPNRLTNLQISVCRKIRELLPTSNCAALLKTAQNQRWIPVLLQWLNLSDHPAVQLDALLALTNIAEVCAQTWPQHGSVPFPPLSFSQKLTPEALAALDASLTDHSGVFNFTLATTPPSTNAFVPPPTPSGPSFPQQLSASSQHLLLRHEDAIPTLIELLGDEAPEIYEQALWILGSIAASADDKSVSARDVLLAAGVLNKLILCLNRHPNNLSLKRIGSWTLSNLLDNLFSGTDMSSQVDMVELLPVLKRFLKSSDSEVLSYTCWTLSHLCDSASHIAVVVTPDGGLVPRLVELLLHASWRVTKPALRTIGNIVCAEAADEDFTEVILEYQAVPRLKDLISHTNREIQKEACWTLSNISAGTVDQIQAVIDSGAIPFLVDLVQSSRTDHEVRSEACWVVLNATSCGSDAQIEVLVSEGCVAVLGVLLTEASMVMMALEGLERVLQVEESSENRPQLVSAELIEKARDSHTSSTVTKRAERIWKQHFVSCALCKLSFSKHRTADASWCDECKSHICSSCNCTIYHLDYQEELWAATEKTETKKNKSKKANKKKKAKMKKKEIAEQQIAAAAIEVAEKKSRQQIEEEERLVGGSASITTTTKEAEAVVLVGTGGGVGEQQEPHHHEKTRNGQDDCGPAAQQPERPESPEPVMDNDVDHQIDLVLYLQQTGSIIALSKLMDALETAEDDLDDYERKMINDIRLAS
jgi:importin subunit alpha-6/7